MQAYNAKCYINLLYPNTNAEELLNAKNVGVYCIRHLFFKLFIIAQEANYSDIDCCKYSCFFDIYLRLFL